MPATGMIPAWKRIKASGEEDHGDEEEALADGRSSAGPD